MKGLSSRELCSRAEAAGGVFLRYSGDHRIYRMPTGRLLPVPVSGSQRECSIGLLRRAKRLGVNVD